MTEKLTFEEWCEKYIKVDPNMKQELSMLHGIDADKEIDAAVRREYDFYINGGFQK